MAVFSEYKIDKRSNSRHKWCNIMSSDRPEIRNLIMCVTPLQMLIAERIIGLNPDKTFDLIVVALNDNEKYKHYYNRLKKSCFNSLYYIPKAGLNGFLDYIKQLKESFLTGSYQGLYLASIDLRHFQYIVSKNSSAYIYTFDDGTANIIPSSLYYLNSKPKLLKRAVWRVFGVKYYMEDLKKMSKLHYTIYQDIPNIIENRQYIPLTSKNDSGNHLQEKVIKFYLGQPLTDISDSFDLLFTKKNIDKLGVDYYYPHPRENTYPEGVFQLISSPLIFEDYIISFLKDNPNISVEVFSFTSTALLNVMSMDRVQAIYIHEDQFLKKFYSFYEFVQESFGIPHLSLD